MLKLTQWPPAPPIPPPLHPATRTLLEAAKAQRVTRRELSRRSGISYPALCAIAAGTSQPNLATLQAMADALGYKLVVVPCSAGD